MYARPSNLSDALRLLVESGARIIAGGTDVYPGAGERPLQADYVDVSSIPALRGVSVDGGWVRIGATTTWSDIARIDLPPAFDALKVAARDIGAVQIQNRGTIAGNLCNASPAADGRRPCSSSTPRWSLSPGVGRAVSGLMSLSTALEAPYWRRTK